MQESQRRALIVQEVPMYRKFLTMCLSGMGSIEIDEACSGDEALEKVVSDAYDLILIDLSTPTSDGLNVLSSLRARRKTNKTPVVALSRTYDEDTAALLSDLNATYVAKPTQLGELRQAAREAFGIQSPTVKTGAERREHPRYDLQVTVEMADGNGQQFATEDVSALGAYILCDSPPPIGTIAKARLIFPHLEKPIEISYRVVHHRNSRVNPTQLGYGVRFENDSEELKLGLARAFMSPTNSHS